MESSETLPTKQIHCNNCVQETEHTVLHQHRQYVSEKCRGMNDDPMYWDITYTLLECRGCKSVSLQCETDWSEKNDYDEPEVDFFPPRIFRRKPTWTDELPHEIQELLGEVYTALHADCRRLTAMGVRTLVDMFALDGVGDIGDFQKKLNALVENGYLGQQQRNFLNDTAINAGNAAAHRGYKPTGKVLNDVMNIVEHLLQFYAIEKSVKLNKEAVPPRQKIVKAK